MPRSPEPATRIRAMLSPQGVPFTSSARVYDLLYEAGARTTRSRPTSSTR